MLWEFLSSAGNEKLLGLKWLNWGKKSKTNKNEQTKNRMQMCKADASQKTKSCFLQSNVGLSRY